jgi:hypothetical protein
MARSSTTFRKGQSGNLNGRPKIIAHVRDLARQHTEETIGTLVNIMRAYAMDPAPAVSAAKELLDRGYGKAPMMVTDSESEFRNAIDLSDDELDAIIEQGRRKGILPGGAEADAPEDTSQLH